MVLVLGMDELNCIHWRIDASFAVHLNMHGHTGATISLGNGSMLSGSWRPRQRSSSDHLDEVQRNQVFKKYFWRAKNPR